MDASKSNMKTKQDGLEWFATDIFGLEPRWTREPDTANIEVLVRQHFELEPSAPCNVTFYAQGALNKLYKIETEERRALMRVTLPVDPSRKTNSEVATIKVVHENTAIPVPTIYAFDDSNDNVLGYEWILMEMLPGKTLRSRWRKMSDDAKQKLVRQIARYQAQLLKQKFQGLGNLFTYHEILEQGQRNTSTSSPLGPIVSLIFFWGDHINQNVPRGPFTTSRDWLRSRFSLLLSDLEKILSISEDEDDLEEAQIFKDLANRLLKIFPEVFPQTTTDIPETAVLFHDDLSMQNILVDEEGTITGVIDWECVSVLPLWKACQVPEFLLATERYDKPDRDTYAPDNDEGDPQEKDALDNEGLTDMYWEHLMEYELTQLRQTFVQEMGKIAPEWIENLEKGTDKDSFDLAVQQCDSIWSTKKINAWLDAWDKGDRSNLRRKLYAPSIPGVVI